MTDVYFCWRHSNTLLQSNFSGLRWVWGHSAQLGLYPFNFLFRTVTLLDCLRVKLTAYARDNFFIVKSCKGIFKGINSKK